MARRSNVPVPLPAPHPSDGTQSRTTFTFRAYNHPRITFKSWTSSKPNAEEVLMNISDMDLERPIRAQPREPGVMTRATESPKRAASLNLLGNLALYIVPHAFEDRRTLIAKAAYQKAECRGFAPGHELEDWLAAENEVDQRLAGEGRVF
jgi:hypothetical protein